MSSHWLKAYSYSWEHPGTAQIVSNPYAARAMHDFQESSSRKNMVCRKLTVFGADMRV